MYKSTHDSFKCCTPRVGNPHRVTSFVSNMSSSSFSCIAKLRADINLAFLPGLTPSELEKKRMNKGL